MIGSSGKMDYFVFLALIIAFLSGSCVTAQVTCTQDPNPAMIGGKVNVTCKAAHAKLTETLSWGLPNGTAIDDVHGVTGLTTGFKDKFAKATLSLNLTDFPPERTVSCRLKANDSWENYTVCVSWRIINPPKIITVYGPNITDDFSVAMTCAIVQDCTVSPNPWFGQDGMKVANDTTKGITVTHKLVDGTKGTVVEWKIVFANLTLDAVYGTYTCRASPSIAATGRLVKVEANPTSTSQNSGDETSTSEPSSPSPQVTPTTVATSNATSNGLSTPPSPSPTTPLEINTTDTSGNTTNEIGTSKTSSPSPQVTPTTVAPNTTMPTDSPPSSSPTTTTATTAPDDHQPVGIVAIAIAIVVAMFLGGVVSVVYWKRHMLRDWLMDKDVVKVMKKGKRSKGYKYSKLPKDISTSMKHLE